MRKTVLAAAAVTVIIATGVAATPAAAGSDWVCGCPRPWPARQYWQWGWHQPPPWHWTSPVAAFWGDPDPPLVPADRWARKWHPPWMRHWRRHRHH
jgi:hypothetical protein